MPSMLSSVLRPRFSSLLKFTACTSISNRAPIVLASLQRHTILLVCSSDTRKWFIACQSLAFVIVVDELAGGWAVVDREPDAAFRPRLKTVACAPTAED